MPNPARVLSLSLGGSGSCDPASQNAINTALGLGAVVVVAAGNENQSASIHSPASCSGVITVAATTKTGRRARYSNYGSKVEIAAPGGNADGIDPDILSTLNSGATIPNPSGYIYARYAGTSMATPHVSGVASLMLSVNPALTPAQVLAKIQSTARAFPAPGPACNAIPQASACDCTTALCGAGILDAGAAVASAAGGNTTLTSSANPGSAGVAITFTATVTGNAPTGTVRFDDGGTTLAGCAAVPLAGTGDVRTAACTTSNLAVGSHSIAASYSGDAYNIASNGTLAQDVFNATTTVLASSGNPAFVGASVTYSATVTGISPTGTVRFEDGGAAIAGCATVALAGSGNTRTATCPVGTPATGSHAITATYSGDSGNGSSGAMLTQIVAPPVPGIATIVTNPYGTLSVQGATLSGNTITNMSDHVVIQFGNIAGSPSVAAEIDFQGFNLGTGRSLDVRSGAAGQFVFLVDKGSAPSVIAGELVANDFGGGFPVPYLKNRNGITITAGGLVNAQGGIGIDTLGATWTVGQPLINDGVIDAGASLELVAAKIGGSGGFRGDNVTIRTFGDANNPVNGAFFLSNGLLLQSGHGTGPATSLNLTIDAYGSTPQVLNFRSLSNARVWMPSSWPAGSTVPANNAVVSPNGVRPAGMPDPGYGGGSMIVQSDHALSLVNGGGNDFVFPGGIVLKAGGTLDLNGVLVNQGWTTSGQAFQGLFFESPNIVSTNGNIRLYSNDLNWANFSTLPQAPVRSFTLVRNGDGTASFAPADAIAPHLNTYSILIDAAANGQCWVCLFNAQPVDMYGP